MKKSHEFKVATDSCTSLRLSIVQSSMVILKIQFLDDVGPFFKSTVTGYGKNMKFLKRM